MITCPQTALLMLLIIKDLVSIDSGRFTTMAFLATDAASLMIQGPNRTEVFLVLGLEETMFRDGAFAGRDRRATSEADHERRVV
eukprot:2027456-Pyramimonas_sp.AAC.1